MQKEATTHAVSEKSPGQAITILIADDSESNQALFSLYFKSTDYKTDFAENGRQAVDAFKAASYDLVLMDIFMPVLDGLDATREIRAYERAKDLPPTPIVAVSANTFNQARENCVEAGCTDFLTKPIRKKTLLECIAHIVEGSKR